MYVITNLPIVLRYPSASTLRSVSVARSPNTKHYQEQSTFTKGHLAPKDSHIGRTDNRVSNLNESSGRREPQSILKNSITEKTSKDLINEFQRREDRGHILENSKPITISDDEEDVPKKSAAEQNREKLKAAPVVDPNCPDGIFFFFVQRQLL